MVDIYSITAICVIPSYLIAINREIMGDNLVLSG